MKRAFYLTIGGLLGMAGYASAQGLLGISPEVGEPKILPLTYGISAGAGYDSNVNTTATNKTSSAFVQGGVRAGYSQVWDRTHLTIDANAGLVHNFDQDDDRFDKTSYNFRLGKGLQYAISENVLLRNNAHFSYQIEPDYRIGQSISRRSDQFWFIYNSLMFDYVLTDRFTATSGYDINYINYENDLVGAVEDRIRHQFTQNIRYHWTESTSLRAEYRFAYTDYKSGASARSHYALGGVDHAFDDNTRMTALLGAEFRETRGVGIDSNKVAPFAEVGLSHEMTDISSLRWANRLGYEDSQIGLFSTNYSYRSSLDYTHQLGPDLTGNVGLVYNHARLDGGPAGSRTDNIFVVNLGLNYNILDNLGVGAGYNFTTVDSNDAAQDYDRHRVNVNVNASF
jgi:opacity protein-like surface antigen